jgi:uncharacterized protein
MDKPVTTKAHCTATIETASASKHLQQLCKHFAHKTTVTFDPTAGRIALSSGDCELAASDNVLTISLVAADDTYMAQLQDVVVRHLVRFAFRETLQIDWRAA